MNNLPSPVIPALDKFLTKDILPPTSKSSLLEKIEITAELELQEYLKKSVSRLNEFWQKYQSATALTHKEIAGYCHERSALYLSAKDIPNLSKKDFRVFEQESITSSEAPRYC
jgi:hypothetical protein